MVPLKTQAAICENHAPNQEALQVKSRAYSEGVRSAIDHVEAVEREKTMPKLTAGQKRTANRISRAMARAFRSLNGKTNIPDIRAEVHRRTFRIINHARRLGRIASSKE
jgi:ABC-type ATPase involved in cell division